MFDFKLTEQEKGIINDLRGRRKFVEGNNCFIYKKPHKIGTINFLGDNIIEMIIENNDGDNIFYLQSEMNSFSQMVNYLDTFTKAMNTIESIERDNIRADSSDYFSALFVCTCGATSTYICQECQKLALEKGLDIKFRAIGIDRLEKKHVEFDVIEFLPQISYLLKRKDYPYKDKIHLLNTMDVATRNIENIFSQVLSDYKNAIIR